MAQVIEINPLCPEDEKITTAAEIILGGGVVICPTETFYGLAVNCFNYTAVDRVYQIKQRSREKPLIVLITDLSSLNTLGVEINSTARRYIEKYWPGNLTLVFKTSNKSLPVGIKGNDQTIAIRMTSYKVTRRIVERVGFPITATSANISGCSSPSSGDKVIEQLGNKVDLILDGGQTEGGLPSTIIDVSSDNPRLIREGTGGYNVLIKNEI